MAVDEIEVVELYSCFPSAVRVQQRALGLPLDGTPTVTGGMAFAGGPFNNFVLQSMAAVVPLLRDGPDRLGCVMTAGQDRAAAEALAERIVAETTITMA